VQKLKRSKSNKKSGEFMETKGKEYTIIVNGEQKTEPKEVLTFVDVLDLAFPPPRPIPNKDFSITYKNAKSIPHHGQLQGRSTLSESNLSFLAVFAGCRL
jgi:hypothetical protein